MIEHFADKDRGGFFTSADDAEKLIARDKDAFDGAVPSGNSVAMLNLLSLGRMTADAQLEELAAKVGRAFSKGIEQSPPAYTQFLIALDFALGPSSEVVIAGDPDAQDAKNMICLLGKGFIPSKVVLLRSQADAKRLAHIADFTEKLEQIDGQATAYVCREQHCKTPVTNPEDMLKSLK